MIGKGGLVSVLKNISLNSFILSNAFTESCTLSQRLSLIMHSVRLWFFFKYVMCFFVFLCVFSSCFEFCVNPEKSLMLLSYDFSSLMPMVLFLDFLCVFFLVSCLELCWYPDRYLIDLISFFHDFSSIMPIKSVTHGNFLHVMFVLFGFCSVAQHPHYFPLLRVFNFFVLVLSLRSSFC